ncbi:MAG: adenylate kinase [Synergistaceae bacterium]|jgi:adenylate kinase|nr:adenylate kinase [Synergistaceae bacterium]
MRLVLLGAPGAGKGTQANLLKEKYGCVHISTGDIFRRNLKEKTELGLQAESFMSRGELVPDSLVVKMVSERFREKDVAKGFLMDGFPRTIVQAEAFETVLNERGYPLDGALLLKIEEEVLVQRLTNRRTCRSCGGISNLLTMREPEGKRCLTCGGELYQREDDEEEVIRNRLKVYREQTALLVAWYGQRGILYECDASGTQEEIFTKIQMTLEKHGIS